MDEPTLDFSLIQDQWQTLLLALGFKLEREFPANHAASGAREVLYLTWKVAHNTYNTILFICGDKPPDPFHRPEYVVSCPPIVRTLLDTLFNVVFLLEDLDKRADWYHKAGWREQQEKLLQYSATYANDPHPNWKPWLSEFEKHQEVGKKIFGISAAEAADMKKIPWWPTPHQMIPKAEQTNAAFLRYLEAWFYRELSQASHLSLPGLAARGAPLLALSQKLSNADGNILKLKSQQVMMTMTMMLAIASEIEIYFSFGLKDRLEVIWKMFDHFPIPKEVWDKRYEASFAARSTP